jgi:hypothetical protein
MGAALWFETRRCAALLAVGPTESVPPGLGLSPRLSGEGFSFGGPMLNVARFPQNRAIFFPIWSRCRVSFSGVATFMW